MACAVSIEAGGDGNSKPAEYVSHRRDESKRRCQCESDVERRARRTLSERCLGRIGHWLDQNDGERDGAESRTDGRGVLSAWNQVGRRSRKPADRTLE